MPKTEIMAPAGSFASASAAINAGANSIYFGIQQLNMRARAAYNFQISDLAKLAEQTQAANVKSYLTLNTLLYDHDLNLMREIMDEAHKVGISAVICADLAAINHARSIGMQIHASTQLSISNFEAVKFYAEFADTLVLARELDMQMIKKICDLIKEENITGPAGELVKIETFVHGALCIAPAGRCQMSIIQTNTSAQRGACLQECRKKYRIIEEETGREMRVENEYILSPKDLCTIDFVDQLVDAGISIFKLEGRGRSPQYVDTVVRAYREAVDAIEEGTFSKAKVAVWKEQLATVYNRGFSDGYFMGKPLPDWSGYGGNRSSEQRVFAGIVKHYFDKAQVAEIQLQAHPLETGDKIVVMGQTTGVVHEEVSSIRVDDKQQESAKHPNMITVPISNKVRHNDQVYILKKRTNIKES